MESTDEPPNSVDSNQGESEEPITFSSPAFSYVNPKLILKRNRYGIAQHAKEKIYKDEVLIGWSGMLNYL